MLDDRLDMDDQQFFVDHRAANDKANAALIITEDQRARIWVGDVRWLGDDHVWVVYTCRARPAAIPNSRLHDLPGQAHDASPASIAAGLKEFFA